MKRVYIYTVSCRRRSLDATKISEFLIKNDYELVGKPEKADIIVFITCAFIDKMVEFSLDKVKEFQKYNAELIVAGCLPAIEKEKLSKIFNGKVICTSDINKISQYFSEKKIKFSELNDANFLYSSLSHQRIKKIYYLKPIQYISKKIYGENSFIFKILLRDPYIVRVSWGCLGNCSYCAIKKAIGPYKSKPIEECLNELKRGIALGYREILLTADDIGGYGLDIGHDFLELLQSILNLEGDFKIWIESLRPIWILKYFGQLKEIFMNQKIQYIDCAIQSGSKKILKSMNRYSNIKKIIEALSMIKVINPEILLTTEIIIGFPGETEEDLQQTLESIQAIQFDGGFIYKFALKEGTKAENIEPKIPDKEILRRIKIAKSFLKNEGYRVKYLSKKGYYIFDKHQKSTY